MDERIHVTEASAWLNEQGILVDYCGSTTESPDYEFRKRLFIKTMADLRHLVSTLKWACFISFSAGLIIGMAIVALEK